MRKAAWILGLMMCCSLLLQAQVRHVQSFNKGWKFYAGDDSLASQTKYNDSKWRSLQLPHDWSIESHFSGHFPATNQGGALPGGIGWYRKTFTMPASASAKLTSIHFDGVYKNSEVWINGHWLGKRPNGYVNFSYDLTPYLYYGKTNVIAVRVDNAAQPDSRWYSGSGIYRDVQLVTTNKVSLANEGGVFVTTPIVSNEYAQVSFQYDIRNADNEAVLVNVYTDVLDASGKKIASSQSPILRKVNQGKQVYADVLRIARPVRWSVEHPYLYKAITKIEVNGQLVDEQVHPLGIRSLRFDSEKGFFLNEQPLKIQGVCQHHDLGVFGAAFNKAAAIRQLRILKEMGVNAIRFSHNPPASTLLDLCDSMGFLVVDEAFDMWRKKKNKFDYHLQFNDWHEQDLRAIVLRDRNHPSVFMWSIGNEIREQFDSSGTVIARRLSAIVKSLDTTRPVTSALTETFLEKNFIAQSNALDVLSFNYKEYDYPHLPKRFPGASFIASETASALSTRGVYVGAADSMHVWPPNFKEQENFSGGYADTTCNAYDNTYAYWGATHEKAWLAVKKYPHIAGGFVWSGFDYLGEPLPYNFPARSSYYGIIDLAGFPKDVYYMYQSEWTNKPVLHVLPHWNWKKGDTVDVVAYYSQADAVELFLNDRSLGKKSKSDSSLHVQWRVPFASGSIKAIAWKDGKIVQATSTSTTGKPVAIRLLADRKIVQANGQDAAFIEVQLVDAQGRVVPDADVSISATVTGAATLVGTDNGFQADTVSLKSNQRRTWKGKALVVVQSAERQGNITVTVKAAGIATAVIALKCQ